MIKYVSYAYGFCLSDDDKLSEIADASDKVEEKYTRSLMRECMNIKKR